MARGGSKKGERRGGREPGTPNKLPKGERALVKLDAAEREVRVIQASGKDIAALGKDRLAELARVLALLGAHRCCTIGGLPDMPRAVVLEIVRDAKRRQRLQAVK